MKFSPDSFSFRLMILGITLALSGVMIIIGLKNNRRVDKLLKNCTAAAEGVITSVDHTYDSDKHEDLYSYKILFADETGKRYEFETRQTTVKYETGEKTTIHYDPNDVSFLYSDAVRPSKGTIFFIGAAAAPVFGIINLFVRRRR